MARPYVESVVGVDVLAKQRELFHPLLRHPSRFRQYLFNGSGELCAAGVGHHAKAAELVAALLNRQERRNGFAWQSLGIQALELIFSRELGFDHGASALASPSQQLRQPMVGLGPEDEVHRRRPLDDLFTFSLRHASCHGDQRLGTLPCPVLLHPPELAQLGIDLFRRLLANMAGVEDDEVGLFGMARLGMARGTSTSRMRSLS